MLENFTYDGEKRPLPPKKLSVTICKFAQIFVNYLLLLEVIN